MRPTALLHCPSPQSAYFYALETTRQGVAREGPFIKLA